MRLLSFGRHFSLLSNRVRHFSSIGGRMPIVSASFDTRGSLFESSIRLQNTYGNTSSSDDSPEKSKSHPRDYSSVRLNYKFHDDAGLTSEYVNFYGAVRLGKIFEDLDAVAGFVALKHTDAVNPVSPLTIVTASVDKIGLCEEIEVDRNYSVNGFVSWTGNSSMEVTILLTDIGPGDTMGKEILKAGFVMVARDPRTYKAARIPALALESEEEHAEYEFGAVRNVERNRRRKASEDIAPSADEFSTLYKLYRQLEADPELKTEIYSRKPGTFVPISRTKMESTLVMHPQDRNMNNKVFGGYLMREAFESAWSSCYMFCGELPSLLSVDEIHFLSPVDIGSLVKFTSKIVHVGNTSMRVLTECLVVDPKTGRRSLTNLFSFTFSNGNAINRKVYPETYIECVHYMQAERKYKDLLSKM